MDIDDVVDTPELRNRTLVFRDRVHAGAVLAILLEGYRDGSARVLGIPAGGVPVAAELSRQLGLALDVAVISKLTLPWNTEVGYGAVAFDGTVRLNEALIAEMGLEEGEIARGIERTKRKIERRTARFRGERAFPDLSAGPSVLVDDGLASGFTMRVAVEALRKLGASEVVVAVPTAHDVSVAKLTPEVDALYCANLRSGWGFAVADAYRHWTDVEEHEVDQVLAEFPR